MNYIHIIKRLITKMFPRRYLKVKREIKHLSWLMIVTFSSCYCGQPLHSNPMCSSDKENLPFGRTTRRRCLRSIACVLRTHRQQLLYFLFLKNKVQLVQENDCSLLKSLNHPNTNIGEVIELIFRIIYNRPKSEKTLRRRAMQHAVYQK